jgi:hypothetical protein
LLVEVSGRPRIKVARRDEWQSSGVEAGLQIDLEDGDPEAASQFGAQRCHLHEILWVVMQAHRHGSAEQSTGRNPDEITR